MAYRVQSAYRRRCFCRYRFLAFSLPIFKAKEIPGLEAAALCALPPPVWYQTRLVRELSRRGLATLPERACAGAIVRSEGGSAGAPAAVRDLVPGRVI